MCQYRQLASDTHITHRRDLKVLLPDGPSTGGPSPVKGSSAAEDKIKVLQKERSEKQIQLPPLDRKLKSESAELERCDKSLGCPTDPQTPALPSLCACVCVSGPGDALLTHGLHAFA